MCLFWSTDWKLYFNTEHMGQQHKIDWRDITRKIPHLLIPPPILIILFGPARDTIAVSSSSHSLASLSHVSLNIYLMRTGRSTYVCSYKLFIIDGVNHLSFIPLLWCHCYDRPLKYGKSKCFDTHTDTVETLPRSGLTVSTCSEWMESNTKRMWFYPPKTECITHWNQHHDLEWQNKWNI